MYNNEMQTLMAEGGMKDDGGTKDPVSGNDVPPGALQSEVRDDIDAKLSEGEFVIPADVVRYIGLNNLMKLRDEAKAGLAKMESIGQMGNASEVPDAEALHEDDFDSTLDEVMTEVEKEHTQGYATGGMVRHYDVGGMAPTSTYVDPANAAKYARAPLKGFEMVRFEKPDGTAIYIPYISGRPQLEVPEGYTMKTGVASSKPADTAVTGITTPTGNVKTGGGPGPSGGGATGGVGTGKTTTTTTTSSDTGSSKFSFGDLGSFGNISVNPDTGIASADKASFTTGAFAAVVGLALGINPALSATLAKTAEEKVAQEKAQDYNMKYSDTAPISGLFGPASVTATTGTEGTGNKAGLAGVAAAEAAANAGYSAAAQGAAAQAAANAALAGATQSDAITAGLAAAKALDASTASQVSSQNTQSRSMDVGVGKTSGSSSQSSPVGRSFSVTAGPLSSGVSSGDSGGGRAVNGGINGGWGSRDAGGNTGGEGGGDGGGFAKGGLVSKPHKKSTNKKAGLASR
jgi:hypothetical protein